MNNLILNPQYDKDELKKYGFKYSEFEDWHIFSEDNEIEISFGDNGEFIFDNGGNYIEHYQIEWVISIIYDLIKNNLLIMQNK